MPTESVTGIGGKDVSADDPSLDGEYQGHPGLDEEEGEEPEEDDLVEFISDRGVHYAGRVVKTGRYLVVEMHDKRRVSTRAKNPSLKKLK